MFSEKEKEKAFKHLKDHALQIYLSRITYGRHGRPDPMDEAKDKKIYND